MENNYLDKVVKDKLQHLDVEYQADTWDLLEQKLALAEDATKLDDTALDGMVYAALQDFEVPYDANDWDTMSQRLDDNLIDSTILGALQDIETPYHESNWAAMSQRIDDELLDDTVYDALNDLDAAYNENHWVMMSERLDVIFARPLQIIRYKLAELAFLLLLIFGVGEFIIPANPSTTDVPVAENGLDKLDLKSTEKNSPNDINLEQDSKVNNTQFSKAFENKAATKENSKSQTIAEIVKNINKKDYQSSKSTSKKETIKSLDKTTAPALIKTESNTEQLLEATGTNQHVSNSTNASSSENTKEAITSSNINSENTPTLVEGLANKAYDILSPVNLLNRDIPFLNDSENPDFSSIPLLTIPTKKKAQIRVGMFASANLDFIFTPYDPVLGLQAYSRYAPGYGGGVSLGWKFNRWEVETAIAYMSKRYKNRPFIHIYGGSVVEGYQANALTGIELNIINIPLHINYHIINTGKLHLYGLTGGTMQVVLQADYDANRAELGGGKAPSFSGGTEVSQDNDKSLFNRKDFNDGFLADKDFIKNSYYSIDIGMGLEYYLSPYWNIFIQPTYQYNLPEPLNTDGLGPNNDKINTGQLLIGVKSNLK